MDQGSDSDPRDLRTSNVLPPHRWRSRSDANDKNNNPSEISEDDEPPILPASQLISLSSTPPKKTWERHFRSFLTKQGSKGSPDVVSAIDPDQLSVNRKVGSSRSKFSLVPGSRRLLARQTSDESMAPAVLAPTPGLATIPKHKSFGDMTVKGGSFFSHVFQKDASKSPTQSLSRKARSMDALDTSLRKGSEKAHSPLLSHHTIDHTFLSTPELPILHSRKSSSSLKGSPQSPRSRMHPTSSLSETLGDAYNAPLLQRSTQALEPADLPTSFVASAKTPASTEIKKAFTEFHNSPAFSKDSTSAYLGDDSSVSGNTFFAMYGSMASKRKDSEPQRIRASTSGRQLSRSLEPVSEELLMYKSQRMLKPVAGPDSWGPARRYLIAPAVLATCTLQVLPALSGSKKIYNFDDCSFGTLVLGDATISYVGKRNDSSGWSSCILVLRQNYLLEYDRESGVSGIPRGFAHLQFSHSSSHENFLNVLELDFFGSPCAKSDKRKLLIRVGKTADRDRWISCLNHASKLAVHDLYDFDENNKIGQGRYASVYKARRKDDKGNSCAIKIVDKSEFWSRVVKNMERADTLVREASIQATLSSKGDIIPSVLKIRGLFETADNIVFELDLLEGNDLFRYVSSRGSLAENEAASILRDILVCLEAMYRFGVAHRDIKPANIIMCDKETDGVHVKLADFGMSTFVGVDGLLRGRCGTPGYVAPEIFKASINGGYGMNVDTFSAGVTLYVMICGYEPFYGETDVELVEANKQAIVEFPEADWVKVSDEARDLVKSMLEADPSKRISAKDALQHPWISSRTETVSKQVELSSKDYSSGAACAIS